LQAKLGFKPGFTPKFPVPAINDAQLVFFPGTAVP
jgi:hypothetical protein